MSDSSTRVRSRAPRFWAWRELATRWRAIVLNLGNVRPLPRALSAFLVLLGVAALGHALVTAGTVGLVGLVVGIPLGVVLGRMAWRWVAESTPLARNASRLRPVTVLRAE